MKHCFSFFIVSTVLELAACATDVLVSPFNRRRLGDVVLLLLLEDKIAVVCRLVKISGK